MTKINKSPDRHSFQKEGYIKRCEEKGETPNKDYLDMFEKVLEDAKNKWSDPASRENNMEYDLLTTPWICDKAKSSDIYAQNLYAAMCNNSFQRNDMMPILKDQRWSCSWRYAAGIVADMQEKGDYINWYCSGMGGLNQEYDGEETNEQWQKRTGYVPEKDITNEIRDDLKKLGWIVINEE